MHYEYNALELLSSILMISPGMERINGPLWSLYIEWRLYISGLFFFLFLQNNKYNKKLFYIFGFIMSLCIAFYNYGIKALPYIFIWYLGVFFILNNKYFNNSKIFIIIFVFLGLLLLKFGINVMSVHFFNYKIYSIVQVLLAAIFILISLNYSGKILFDQIAPCSYTLYILHFPLTLFLYGISQKVVDVNDHMSLAFIIPLVILINCFFSFQLAKYLEVKDKFRILIHNLLSKSLKI